MDSSMDKPWEMDKPFGDDEWADDEWGKMPVVVSIAMSDEQAKREHRVCGLSEFPDSSRIYFEMDDAPADICVVEETGWAKRLRLKKADFPKLISLWYPDGIKRDWNWRQELDRIDGDTVWVIGFGD